MSQYLIMLVEDEHPYYVEGGEAVMAEVVAGHAAFGAKYGDKILGGNGLQPTTTATSMRPDGAGGWVITDGPFLEAKEVLGGYYLVEVADLDEVIAMAKDIPVPFGGVEIRPVMVFN